MCCFKLTRCLFTPVQLPDKCCKSPQHCPIRLLVCGPVIVEEQVFLNGPAPSVSAFFSDFLLTTARQWEEIALLHSLQSIINPSTRDWRDHELQQPDSSSNGLPEILKCLWKQWENQIPRTELQHYSLVKVDRGKLSQWLCARQSLGYMCKPDVKCVSFKIIFSNVF